MAEKEDKVDEFFKRLEEFFKGCRNLGCALLIIFFLLVLIGAC